MKKLYVWGVVLGMLPLSSYGSDRFSPMYDIKANGVSPNHYSGYVNWTSDYVYRGYSMSDSMPAQQGSINYHNDSGLFAGWWVSTLKLTHPYGPNIEHDIYFGQELRWSDMWHSEIRMTYFNYRGGRTPPPPQKQTATQSDPWAYLWPGESGMVNTANTNANSISAGNVSVYRPFIQWQLTTTYTGGGSARFYYTGNTYGMHFSSVAMEFEYPYALSEHWLIDGMVGHWNLEHFVGKSYTYSDFSLRYQRRHFSASVHYHTTTNAARVIYGRLADPGWLVMFAVGF